MKRLFFFTFLIFYFIFSCFAQQNKIDSLENLLEHSKNDTITISLLGQLANSFTYSAPEKSMEYSLKEMELGKQLIARKNDRLIEIGKKAQADALNNLGVIDLYKGNNDKAQEYFVQSKKIREELGQKNEAAKVIWNIGLAYFNKSRYEQALQYYLQALKIHEETRDTIMTANTMLSIGNVFNEQKDYKQAVAYFNGALILFKAKNSKMGIANCLLNTGNAYYFQQLYDTTIVYYLQALKIYQELNDKLRTAAALNNIGAIYAEKGDFSKAINYYLESIKIKEQINDKPGITATLSGLCGLYLDKKNYAKAIEYNERSLTLAKEMGLLYYLKGIYGNFCKIYQEMNQYQNAYQYHQLYVQIKDSLFNEESQKQITEMQTKYETEKKEQQIKLLNKDKEIQTKDLQRQKTIRNAVAGGLMLVLLFSFVLINRLLLIRKQKKVIEIERERSEKLLLNILPKEIAEELKRNTPHPKSLSKGEGLTPAAPLSFGEGSGVRRWLVTPKKYEMVTVMFTDFKGFTTIAEKMSAEELVSELDFIFKKFDEIISKYPIEKIKTIGDAYMCAGGLPVANTTNPMDVVMAGLEIQEWMKAQNKWQLRLGIHTGSVIAGVVGDKKFAYDIWGDTVNTASRMESSGEAGKVNISGATYQLLQNLEFKIQNLEFQYRGKIPAKNKGEIEMYFVERK